MNKGRSFSLQAAHSGGMRIDGDDCTKNPWESSLAIGFWWVSWVSIWQVLRMLKFSEVSAMAIALQVVMMLCHDCQIQLYFLSYTTTIPSCSFLCLWIPVCSVALDQFYTKDYTESCGFLLVEGFTIRITALRMALCHHLHISIGRVMSLAGKMVGLSSSVSLPWDPRNLQNRSNGDEWK